MVIIWRILDAVGSDLLRYELLEDCLFPWVADDDELCDRLAGRIDEVRQKLQSSGELGIDLERSPVNLALFERFCEVLYPSSSS